MDFVLIFSDYDFDQFEVEGFLIFSDFDLDYFKDEDV